MMCRKHHAKCEGIGRVYLRREVEDVSIARNLLALNVERTLLRDFQA